LYALENQKNLNEDGTPKTDEQKRNEKENPSEDKNQKEQIK
jgi:hypothetical protein